MLVFAKEAQLDRVINIVFAGKGGSGIFTASAICAQAAFLSGFDVKTGGSKGIAQRGGTVVSYLRYGKKVFSPKIEKEQADFTVSIDADETAESYLAEAGTLIKMVPDLQEHHNKFANVYLLGRLSSCLPFKEEIWCVAIKDRFADGVTGENLRIFLEGRNKSCMKSAV